jgi:hypothetical protein
MRLQLLALVDIDVKGWSTSNKAEIQIARMNSQQLEFAANGRTLSIRTTFGFLRIAGFSPYHFNG